MFLQFLAYHANGYRSTKIPLFSLHEKSPPNGELISWRAAAFQVWNYFAQENEIEPAPRERIRTVSAE
jgi:hypothetical protein